MFRGTIAAPMIALMHLWNLVAASLWILFLWKRVRNIADKQNTGELAVFFVAGLVSVPVALALYYVNPLYWGLISPERNPLLFHVFVVGVAEELAKFLCFAITAHALMSIREPQDGVIQAAVVGLAFATVENAMYIERYRVAFMFVRPVLSSGGHMIYGAIWGGFYSAAVYSNLFSKDQTSYRLAFAGLALGTVIHGLYNTLISSVVFGLGLVLRVVTLWFSVRVFLYLVDFSPYRVFPLSAAKKAIESIRKGLHFNPRSAILNRNMGLYRMYLSEYRKARANFTKASRRLYDPRRPRFFAAVCGLSFLPRPHALREMRVIWSQLTDEQRTRLVEQLRQLLVNDDELLQQVLSFIGSAFAPREWSSPEELARELRRRKAKQRSQVERSPVVEELASQLSREERRRLARQVGATTRQR